jgi:hypothetical protein
MLRKRKLRVMVNHRNATGDTDMTIAEPKGKKTLRRTVRGSLCGYIGGKLWINFGEVFEVGTQDRADEWLNA